MERFQKIACRLLFPCLAVVLLSVPIAAVLLIYTFATAGEYSAIAYLAYVLSAYSLTITCAWLTKNGKAAKTRLQSTLHENPWTHRYLTDVSFKLQVSLYVSLGLNLFYAAVKFACGVWYRSLWFGTLAVYYFLLSLMRFSLLRHGGRIGFGNNIHAELKQYRMCGIVLMLMNAALSFVVVLVVRQNEGFHYPGYLIYVIALYAFYNVITAVVNVIKYQKFNSPAMSAAKVVKLASALVSMLALETAMLAQFDERENPEAFRRMMTGITGGFVCAIILVLAICMIVRSTKQLKTEEPI